MATIGTETTKVHYISRLTIWRTGDDELSAASDDRAILLCSVKNIDSLRASFVVLSFQPAFQ